MLEIIFLILVYVATAMSGGITIVGWIMASYFLAMLIPTMWREIRVFGPTVLVAIPMYLRLI